MKKVILGTFISCLIFISTNAQTSSMSSFKERPQKGLFESDQILDITLKGSFRQILNDREGEAKYYPVELTYAGDDSSETSIPIEIKTRGHFRREKGNCTFPPLLLSFSVS